MKRTGLFILVVVTISLLGFGIHFVSLDWVMSYGEEAMAGHIVKPFGGIHYASAITSVEMGLGFLLIYGLVRNSLSELDFLDRGVLLGILMLMVNGQLFRQSFMEWWIGNPVSIVVVQGGIVWILWIAMGIAGVFLYEELLGDLDS